MQLEQFAWLLDNDNQPRHPIRLWTVWGWATEMAQFQRDANRTGKAVEYYQRGKVLRTLLPSKAGAR